MTGAAPPWESSASFDEYRLLRPLGRGAMGRVFVGQDTLLDRPVAVKVIAAASPDPELQERFRLEARAIARIHHPNVVEVYRVGSVHGYPYLVSELVSGESLDHVPAPLPWPRVLAIAIGLSRGLGAAHRRGVLHRDIKPANVMLTQEGEVKILDFGVAKLFDAGAGPAPSPADAPFAPEPSSATLGTESTLDARRPTRASAPAEPALPPAATGRIGTPRYMAPEVWRQEPATPRSDLYSVGVMLYELCSGVPPHAAGTMDALRRAVLEDAVVPLAQRAPEVDASFAAVIDRCLSRAPEERFPSAEALREALEALGAHGHPAPGRRDRPYPGLHSFGVEDRSTFCGRDAELRAVLERLRAEPLVVVAGDSGTGKSSLCRAGVVPAVAEGALGGAAGWATCELVPGRRPWRALAGAVAYGTGAAEAELLDAGQQAPHELARRAIAAAGARGLLVFVDQLEEALTLGAADELEPFCAALAALALAGPRVRILACARGDYLARLATLPALGEHLSGGLYVLPHLSDAGLREAIVAPARGQGFRFEPESVVDALVASGNADGGLPLLQFALAELWARRDVLRGTITGESLAAIGGVEGALARHADGVLAELRPDRRATARRLLLALVLAEGTRARRTRAELLDEGDADGAAALEALVRRRLVVARETAGAPGPPTYELAHEALLRSWDTLRGWLANDEERRALHQRLERARSEWERLGRPREQLWTGRQLAEAAALQEGSLRSSERGFLKASRRAARGRTLVRVAAALIAPLTAAAVYGGIQWRARQQQERDVAAAIEGSGRALDRAAGTGQRVDELRRKAFDAFDARWFQADAERPWAEALKLGAEEAADYDEAVTLLDRTLARYGSRPDLRHRLAEVLFRYVSTAERDHREPVRALLERRMDAMDDTREYQERLRAPAVLELQTEPAGAEVQLEQALESGEAPRPRRRWVPQPRSLGTTPLSGISLPPGSYRLILARGDRPAVLYPLLARRGERLALRVPLPAAIPDGFAYVAPGRFLAGSTDDERVRLSVAYAPPIHETRTGGFLIARHEVTYAEWIAYLGTLPPEERARRQPRGENYFGTIRLDRAAGGSWELAVIHEQSAYRVREGDRFVYRERDHRADQDWLRFPVSGISWHDAQAYVAWLDRRGAPRGARLCGELEWERAARGADGREYPHGDRLEPEDANFDLTYGQRSSAFGPDEVGSHPASDSPYGVADLAGNVGEWLATGIQKYPAAYSVGSFYQDAMTARSMNHGQTDPALRWPFIGLRVCAPAPPP